MLNPRSKKKLIRLVKKVLNGSATQEERRFVEEYYKYFDKGKYDAPELSFHERQDLENEIWQEITRKTKDSKNGSIRPLLTKKWNKIAAAAVIFVIIGGIFFWYNSNLSEKRNSVVVQNKKYSGDDILPGSNKAVLTLSNGSKIILDSVHNGYLASQRNGRVLKLHNGKLTYQVQKPMRHIAVQNVGKTRLEKYNTLTTPRGGQYEITLSDGTKVWLNSASSLTFPTEFTRNERKVKLKGEAYFEVVKNAVQPFKVMVGSMEVEDLGTRFNIMAYSDEPAVKTTLIEGAVRVKKGDVTALLRPGQQAVTTISPLGKIHVGNVDTEETVAWKDGYFSFHSTSIYEIMKQICRWYNVKVSYQDSLKVSLNGNIRKDVKVSQVFKMLELTGELKFIIEGQKIIIRKQ